MDFHRGEIHALCGENGAGKSTLIKVLTGAHKPDSGQVVMEGRDYTGLPPHEALELGISAIYQEFNLIPYLTVAENIFYGRELKKNGFLDRRKMASEARRICQEIGIDIDPNTPVRSLGVAHQQIVEIAKAISKQCKFLIMDEPTAPLTVNEIEMLFSVMRSLKQAGVTILYVSHRLEEIFEMCDRITVMRDGCYVDTVAVSEIDKNGLIKMMVGREIQDIYPPRGNPSSETILEVKNLCTSLLKNVSFSLHKGEILGFGGLVGAGRTETMMALFGADKCTSGEILLHGKPVQIHTPADAIKNGIGLLSEDRKKYGLVLGMPISHNTTYAILNRISPLTFINFAREAQISEGYRKELNTKAPSIRQLAKNLSGGNQQKVVLAKWLAIEGDILIFDEPTRGIDVGAKQEIYQIMRRLSAQGKSVIMVSSEMPELLGISDRLLVMHEGRITGELLPADYSQERVMTLASGQ